MSNPTHHIKIREKGKKTWDFYSGGKSGNAVNRLRIHARQFTAAQAREFVKTQAPLNPGHEFKAVLIRKGPAPSGRAAVRRYNGFHIWALNHGMKPTDPRAGDGLSVQQGTPYLIEFGVADPIKFPGWPAVEDRLRALKAPFRHKVRMATQTVAVIYPGDPAADHTAQSAADFDSAMYDLMGYLFHPVRVPFEVPGMWQAVFCCLLKADGEPWTNPAIAELVVTSDGVLLGRNVGDYGHNAFIGPVEQLVAGFHEMAGKLKLTDGETRWFLKKVRELSIHKTAPTE